MYIYVIIFLLVVISYFNTLPKGGLSKRSFWVFMAGLCLFVGLSDMLGGYDRYIYGELFDELAYIFRSDRSIEDAVIFLKYPKEPGYIVWNWIVATITTNRYIFIFLTTILMYFLFYKGMVKNVKNFGIALILFLGLFFFFTFTYLRQTIAVGIIWCSYRYITERKLLKFIFFIVLAASFHNSAIIFFPMYFLCNKMPTKNQIVVGGCIFLGIGMTGIPSILFEIYGSTSDMESRALQYMNDSYGWRIDYIVEALFFIVYLIHNYDNFQKDKTSIMCFNIALAFCAILLLFTKSLNGGRLGWPFLLGLISILSQTISNAFTTRSISLIGLSFLLYIRILILWGILLYPYKTFLTPGVREGDFIHWRYEYDNNYDYDKLYK